MTTQPPATPVPPDPYRQNPYGRAPYGQAPYGQAPYGQAPYGQTPYGQAPYGQAPYAQPQYGEAPAVQAAPPGPPATRPPVPWWAAVLAALGVLLVAGVVAAAVGGLVVEAATRTAEQPVDETGVRTLRVEGVTGGVRLTTDGAAAGTVVGTSRVTTSWQEADVEAVRDGDELLLRVTCPDQGWPRRCEVGYDLLVDPEVDVVVDIVTGGLQARGLAGDVDVSVTAGGVMLEETTSQDVRVDVTTGGVGLAFVEPPRQVEVAATTGGVDVSVPSDGTAYAVRTSVTVGDEGVSVPEDDDADRSIVASTTVGGISIHTDVQPGPGSGRPSP